MGLTDKIVEYFATKLMITTLPEKVAVDEFFPFNQTTLDSLSILGIPPTDIPTKKQRELGDIMQAVLIQLYILDLKKQARTHAERLIASQIISLLTTPHDSGYLTCISTSKRSGRLITKFTPNQLTTNRNGDLIVGDKFFISKDDLNVIFPNGEYGGTPRKKTPRLDTYLNGYLQRYGFLGTGRRSLVVLDKENVSAYKFSRTEREETRLLHKLACLSVQNNTVRIKRVIGFSQIDIPEVVDILELEYISGKSLHQLLCEETKLSQEKTLRYSSGILNGLLELRQAGIWHHRDIRPANIMIDEEKDRAVIIDLGIATTDKDALAEDNRRFGSPSGRRANDLTSLGQVVYKMAAGEHIFAESKSMERTTYADKLRDHRDWIYERPEERLPPYLRRVEETVNDRGLCGIVHFCLTSEGTDEDYKTLEARFKEYGN